jgi:hypothetical protein
MLLDVSTIGANVLVAFAIFGDVPKKSRAGNVIIVPPPGDGIDCSGCYAGEHQADDFGQRQFRVA